MNFKLYFSRKNDQQIIDQIELIFKKIDIYNKSNDTKVNNIHLYKHQKQYLRYLFNYDKLSVIHSRQLGITFITFLYVYYKCISLPNQNILIITDNQNIINIKTLLSTIVIDKQIVNINSNSINTGVDFENNSHITFIADSDWGKYEYYLNQLSNVTLFFDQVGLTNISMYDILKYEKLKNIQLILTSSGESKSIKFLNVLKENSKLIKFHYIYPYKINFFRKNKNK